MSVHANPSSLCAERFGACELYAHRHCAAPGCTTILYATGDGGFEDAHVCTACGDEFYLLCTACAQHDTRCALCRTEPRA